MALFLLAGCVRDEKPYIISLMNRFNAEDLAPWTITLSKKDQNSLIKSSRGLVFREKQIVQIDDVSTIRIPFQIPSNGAPLVRVAYNKSSIVGFSEARLIQNEIEITHADTASPRYPGTTFRFPRVDPGLYTLELIYRLDPGTIIPFRGVAGGVVSEPGDGISENELELFLSWFSRAGMESGRPLPTGRRLIISSSGTTRDCVLVPSRDRIEAALPPTARWRTLQFWHKELFGASVSGTEILVETRKDGQWLAVDRIPTVSNAQGKTVRIEPKTIGWGDAIRFSANNPRILILLSEPVLLSPTADADKDPLNLILIDLDTARFDRFGCYGYSRRPTSKKLDLRLEDKGFTLFEKAYAPSTWTLSSTAKFLTSRYLHSKMIPESSISPDAPLLAEIMRENGYYCAAFTAGGLLRSPGFERGFHEYHWNAGLGMVEASFPPAQKWLLGRNAPFFLFVHTYEPHIPYTRTEFAKHLPRGRLGDPSRGEPLLPRGLSESSEFTPEEKTYVSALYDGGMKRATEAVVELFADMEKCGLWENTVVIILSDHGEELWEHFGIFGRHAHSLYDEVLRVPFMIYQPEGSGFQRIDEPVSLVDLVPTVADLLNLDWSGLADGISLVPMMNGRDVNRTLPILANMDHPYHGDGICLIQNDHKYMEMMPRPTPETRRFFSGDGKLRYRRPIELFNVRADPFENENIAFLSPGLTKAMDESLRAGVKRALDPIISSSEGHISDLSEDLARQLAILGYIEDDS